MATRRLAQRNPARTLSISPGTRPDHIQWPAYREDPFIVLNSIWHRADIRCISAGEHFNLLIWKEAQLRDLQITTWNFSVVRLETDVPAIGRAFDKPSSELRPSHGVRKKRRRRHESRGEERN